MSTSICVEPFQVQLSDKEVEHIVVEDLIVSLETQDHPNVISTHPEDIKESKKIKKALKRVIKFYTTDSERKDLGLEF
jgi:hypothetical protein